MTTSEALAQTPSGRGGATAVGRVEEFPEGHFRVRTVGTREVGIAQWHGQFYAIRNICPHQGAPICLGQLGPKIAAGPGPVGALEVDTSVPVVACGWHGWEFDLRDGSPIWSESGQRNRRRSYRVRTYPVTVEEGVVSISLSRNSSTLERAAPSASGMSPDSTEDEENL